VPSRTRQYDALVVPSQWLETGPIVVYEAFAAQRPVLGSDLGGIAELVNDGEDGLLVSPADNPDRWAQALVQLENEPSLVAELKKAVRSPRTMSEGAKEMAKCYRRVCG